MLGNSVALRSGAGSTETTGLRLQLSLLAAAATGALFLTIGDLLTNSHAATTLKIGEILKQHLYPGIENAGLLSVVVIVCLACAACWIHQPSSLIDAFSRGFSVFAMLTVATPYSPVADDFESPAEANSTGHSLVDLLISSVAAGEPATRSTSTLTLKINTADADPKRIEPIVTLRDARSARILARQRVGGNEVTITRPRGSYIVEVEAPGYERASARIDRRG